jgi:N utilization substance protein B
MVKTGTRRKSRELALQMLFQLDMGKQSVDHVEKTFWSEREDLEEDVRSFAIDLFHVAEKRRDEIDGLIEKHAEHWRMDRMAAVDRNILRGAVAEFRDSRRRRKR